MLPLVHSLPHLLVKRETDRYSVFAMRRKGQEQKAETFSMISSCRLSTLWLCGCCAGWSQLLHRQHVFTTSAIWSWVLEYQPLCTFHSCATKYIVLAVDLKRVMCSVCFQHWWQSLFFHSTIILGKTLRVIFKCVLVVRLFHAVRCSVVFKGDL